MKKKPLRIVTCCLAGALLTAVPVYDVKAAPSAGVTEYVDGMIENELNTSSPVAGVSLVVTGYLEENMSSASSVEAKDSDKVEASGADVSEEEKAAKKMQGKKIVKKQEIKRPQKRKQTDMITWR